MHQNVLLYKQQFLANKLTSQLSRLEGQHESEELEILNSNIQILKQNLSQTMATIHEINVSQNQAEKSLDKVKTDLKGRECEIKIKKEKIIEIELSIKFSRDKGVNEEQEIEVFYALYKNYTFYFLYHLFG